MFDITVILQWFWNIFIVLLALLMVIQILLLSLKKLAHHHASQTDLDLIGMRAVVTHTVRSRRPGKIRFQTGDGNSLVVDAVSDATIRSGKEVLITSVSHGLCRVLPVELATQQDRGDS